MSDIVYYGEINCNGITKNGDLCVNKAYYINGTNYLCGVHCKKDFRTCLPKRNKKELEQIKKEQFQEELQVIQRHTARNMKNGKKGKIHLTKMYMMKQPGHIRGYLNIYPNFKDKGRVDGIGIPELSPKFAHKIKHGQPGLPPSKNLENFHQGSKCFHEESKDDEPTELFFENQLAFFKDSVPHRHKYKGIEKNKNIPLYFVWKRKDSSMIKYDYVGSRQFYCNFYERIVLQLPEYTKLKEMVDSGTNINICGYDAYMPNESLEVHYLDSNRPFGHELVLYSLLTLNKSEYPWRKYKTEDF